MLKKITIITITFILGGVLGWLLIFTFFQIKENKLQILNSNQKKTINLEEPKKVESKDLKVTAFITPHHLVAKDLIKEVFQKTAEENKNIKIDRIILISPNHFNAGGGNLILADKDWEFDGQKILSDKNLINSLRQEKIAYLQNDIFNQEHGITALLPFVKDYFPETSIVPMIIRDNTPNDEIDKLANFLSQQEGNTLLILSSDFSHELDKNISYLHDKIAIDTIENFDLENAKNLETDCVGGLRLILEFAEKKNYKNFQVLANSNSSEVYNKFFIGDNTSYVTGQFFNSENYSSNQNLNSVENRPVSFLFAGDLMLDRDIRLKIEENENVEFLTEKIKRLFWSQDLNILNLEGTITDNPSVSNVLMNNPNHFRFTFDKKDSQDFFNFNRIKLITGGNNHILNFEQEGVQATADFLIESKIAFFGMPNIQGNNSTIQEIKGKKIAFVSYNYAVDLDLDKVLAEIKKVREKSDLVVVYVHWGLEYHLQESEVQKEMAHQFVDAGADLVIGSHPHVVQPIEVYKNKAIFYSLGNFIFDQYFDEDVKERLAVGVVWQGDEMEFVLVPLVAEASGDVNLMNLNLRTKFLERIANDSSVSDEMRERIKRGGLRLRDNIGYKFKYKRNFATMSMYYYITKFFIIFLYIYLIYK